MQVRFIYHALVCLRALGAGGAEDGSAEKFYISTNHKKCITVEFVGKWYPFGILPSSVNPHIYGSTQRFCCAAYLTGQLEWAKRALMAYRWVRPSAVDMSVVFLQGRGGSHQAWHVVCMEET